MSLSSTWTDTVATEFLEESLPRDRLTPAIYAYGRSFEIEILLTRGHASFSQLATDLRSIENRVRLAVLLAVLDDQTLNRYEEPSKLLAAYPQIPITVVDLGLSSVRLRARGDADEIVARVNEGARPRQTWKPRLAAFLAVLVTGMGPVAVDANFETECGVLPDDVQVTVRAGPLSVECVPGEKPVVSPGPVATPTASETAAAQDVREKAGALMQAADVLGERAEDELRAASGPPSREREAALKRSRALRSEAQRMAALAGAIATGREADIRAADAYLTDIGPRRGVIDF